MIQILVVHPSRLVCGLYASQLDDEPDMAVVAQATSLAEALARLQERACDIVLVSAQLPDNGALELTRAVSRQNPEVDVLVVGLPESKSIILQYVMAGASGYILQDVAVDHLFDNVRAVSENKALVSPTMAAALMAHIAELAHVASQAFVDPGVYDDLTPREIEVLELIAAGKSNREIGEALFIEVGTVKNHVHNILKKLDVSSREDAAAHLPFVKGEEPE
jgi:DNA-binding NarL/FixJ family response regulator